MKFIHIFIFSLTLYSVLSKTEDETEPKDTGEAKEPEVISKDDETEEHPVIYNDHFSLYILLNHIQEAL